ncbi:MAG: flagellar hook-basal body protein [Oscillospiraceae bacterium]|nr:flagellar hook-basal body protein [Oscillospiraceae bacterium]MCL2126115.1 flagellar hook-basal body protein [Oscillospiraceae bacterium]
MYEAVYIAATGLTNQQRRLDTIANNVANINSAAYKSARLDFKDALYTAGIVPALPRTPEGNQQKGHGVMVAGITKDFSTGSMQKTERKLDVAIEGEGFLELEDSNGNLVYSRNGSLNIGNEFDGFYLVNGDGCYIHDVNGERIRVPDFFEDMTIDERGVVTFSLGEDDYSVALGLYTFRNITGLSSVGDGNYSETVASGEKMTAESAVIRQGTLEISNVNLAEEMTRMIRTQRTFSLASRALTTADEMEGIANNMRR